MRVDFSCLNIYFRPLLSTGVGRDVGQAFKAVGSMKTDKVDTNCTEVEENS